jgi:hypothetical protein
MSRRVLLGGEPPFNNLRVTVVERRADFSERWTIAVYAAALFVSAALLFLVQPMFAKALLPLLGGAPAVWNTCVVFYELMLLAGYLYAFYLRRKAKLTAQIIFHLGLVLLVLAFLPPRIHTFLPPPSSTTAVPWLLIMLLVSLGIPLLVLSATSPLLQSWFAATSHRRSDDPYFLYAASNAGSMVGLLCYPFLLEPLVGLRSQSFIWSIGYFVLVACLGAAGFIVYRSVRGSPSTGADLAPATVESKEAASTTVGDAIGVKRIIRWMVLAFIPSSLMLSVTTYLSTAIAPIPLLWVVPLALYLLTFVIAFSGDSERRLRLLRWIGPIVVLLLIVVMALQLTLTPLLLFFLHLAAFFVIALTCHSLLAADRPSKTYLTEFYIWLATGGAAGGIFTAIIAPLIFTTVVEYPLVLALAAFFLRAPSQQTDRPRLWDYELPLLLGAALAVFISLEARYAPQHLMLKVTLAFVVAALVAIVTFRRPLGFAVCVAALLLCSVLYATTVENRLYVERNFFGINTVMASGPYHVLVHGQTNHGIENMRPAERDTPLSYYARSGPLGQIFESLRPTLAHGSVAVVGLGAGSVLCYRTQGQQWTIYEIDPGVDRIARDPRLFRYVDDCAPGTPTTLGDARISLQQAQDNTYAVMILDAYSADYVPVHLITREAVALYIQKMTTHGILAFHTSSFWVDLTPVLTSLAQDAGLVCYANHDSVLSMDEIRKGKFASTWIVMAHQASDIAALIRNPRWRPCAPTNFRVWTDDYSSLVTVIPVHFSIGPQY